MRRSMILFFLVASLVAPPLAAQGLATADMHRGLFLTLGIGGTDAGAVSGFAMTGGAGYRYGPLFLSANVADLTLSHGDTTRYHMDTFSNGQTRCRDSETGQFASSSKCSTVAVDYAASADVNVLIPHSRFFFGAGGRVGGDHNLGYGSIGLALGSQASRLYVVRVNVGAGYISGLVKVGFQLP